MWRGVARYVVLEAAVSAQGHLEADFQPIFCLSFASATSMPWLGSASDLLPRPQLGLVIFGSSRLGLVSVSKFLSQS